MSYVEQNLMLANADSDVHTLLEADLVSAKVALDAIRKHGTAAGAFLKGIIGGSAGRVTVKDVQPPTLPPKLAARAASSMARIFTQIGRLDDLRNAEPETFISVRAADLQELLAVHDDHVAKIERKGKKIASEDTTNAA